MEENEIVRQAIENNIAETNKIVFSKINCDNLKAKQQENYNFQKVSSILADYGFVTMRLNDDWQGADFIAQHVSGTFLKVQLKGRLEVNKKYIGKEIWMCFPADDWKGCYLFSHDEVMNWLLSNTNIGNTPGWKTKGIYNWKSLTSSTKDFMDKHILF